MKRIRTNLPIPYSKTRLFGPNLWSVRGLCPAAHIHHRWIVYAWPGVTYWNLVEHMTTNPARNDDNFRARCQLIMKYKEEASGCLRKKVLRTFHHEIDYNDRLADVRRWYSSLHSHLKRLSWPIASSLILEMSDDALLDKKFKVSGDWL